MRPLRVVPFLLAPAFVGSQNIQILNADEVPVIKSSTETELAPEVKQALDEIEIFLQKYTGNGKFNYGSINRFVEGLKKDYKAINEEGKDMTGVEGIAARNYPNNFFQWMNTMVEKEVEKRATTEVSSELAKFGVDPATAKNPDSALVTNYVTKAELNKLKDNIHIVMGSLNKSLPKDKKLVCKEGMTQEIVIFLREGQAGIPPGTELVDDVVKAKDNKA